jgi:hypothetical protein
MTPWHTLLVLIVEIPALILTVRMGNRKGRPVLGWLLGLVLSWVGLLVMALIPERHRTRDGGQS